MGFSEIIDRHLYICINIGETKKRFTDKADFTMTIWVHLCGVMVTHATKLGALLKNDLILIGKATLGHRRLLWGKKITVHQTEFRDLFTQFQVQLNYYFSKYNFSK